MGEDCTTDVGIELGLFNNRMENFFPTRESQETVYNQIVADLQVAEAAGLPWMDATGRVSTAEPLSVKLFGKSVGMSWPSRVSPGLI